MSCLLEKLPSSIQCQKGKVDHLTSWADVANEKRLRQASKSSGGGVGTPGGKERNLEKLNVDPREEEATRFRCVRETCADLVHYRFGES